MRFMIKNTKVRTILNSKGLPAAEVEIYLTDGSIGRASAPQGLSAGCREQKTSHLSLEVPTTPLPGDDCIFSGQEDFDNMLERQSNALGSDIMLAYSLAFTRACSQSAGVSLVYWVQNMLEVKRKPRVPSLLVAIFSGGIHCSESKIPFQQIMLNISLPLRESIAHIVSIYAELENKLLQENQLTGYSASSGMFTKSLPIAALFNLINELICKYNLEKHAKIAVDVAAEHFYRGKNIYEFSNGMKFSSDELIDYYFSIIRDFNVGYIEDPFDLDDLIHWKELTRSAEDECLIVGDDVFATNHSYLDRIIANSVLIKMNQIGTLSGTLRTINKACTLGMKTCVSHRSYETEDTFMCDLSVGVASYAIKLGGPRRGDRIAKYNQLLRINEEIDQ